MTFFVFLIYIGGQNLFLEKKYVFFFHSKMSYVDVRAMLLYSYTIIKQLIAVIHLEHYYKFV